MKKLQILGTGCPKCKALAQNAEEAAKALGIAERRGDRATELPAVALSVTIDDGADPNDRAGKILAGLLTALFALGIGGYAAAGMIKARNSRRTE